MQQPQQNRTWLIVAVLVILGLTAGLALGLLFGWVVWPVKYTDTSIADLSMEHKEEYVLLVAQAYALDGDLEKAQARLAALDVPNIGQWLSDMIDRLITQGRDESEIQTLVALADGLGVYNPRWVAYLASPTPLPTDTPPPTDTPLPPTDTPVPPPTDTPMPQPTDTSAPLDTPVPPTETPVPQPTDTPVPQPAATNTPKPQPSNTPKPQPTNTPQPTNPPVAQWTWSARLVGPGEDAQSCEAGNLQIRATVVGANGGQIGGIWLQDFYSGQYQVTGNVNSPDFGPGETKFEYGIGGGGKLCIASGQGGGCVTDYSRDMPCYNAPPFEDLWAAGYCECCEVGISKDRCQQLYSEGAQCMKQPRHYSWRIVYKRSW